MNQTIQSQYFKDPYNNNDMNVVFAQLWCKDAIHKFVDNNMNDSNYKFFGKIFNNTNNDNVILRFKHNDWIMNDEWVYQSVNIEFRKVTTMTNKNVHVIAQFCRMLYFIDYLKYNSTTMNPHIAFENIFGNNTNTSFKNKRTNI